jgi:ribonucleoside-triphosphate reductase
LVCKKCGKKEVYVCPECGEEVAVYSRIVGYMRPISTWNPGKVAEFDDRVEYSTWGADPLWYEKYKANYTDKAKHE